MDKLCKNCANLDENYNCEEGQFDRIFQVIPADLNLPTEFYLDLSRACKFFYPKLDCRNCCYYQANEIDINKRKWCNCIKGYLEIRKRYDHIFIWKNGQVELLPDIDLEIMAENCKDFR